MACNGKTCRFSPCMFARVPFTHQAPSFFHYSFSFHFTFVVTLAIFFKKPCAHLPFHIATCEVRTYMPGLYVTPSIISADIHIEKLQILNVYIYIIYVLYKYIYMYLYLLLFQYTFRQRRRLCLCSWFSLTVLWKEIAHTSRIPAEQLWPPHTGRPAASDRIGMWRVSV
jgi:hypothetical protein